MMKRNRRTWFLSFGCVVGLASASTACNAILGIEEVSDDKGAGADAGGTGGGATSGASGAGAGRSGSGGGSGASGGSGGSGGSGSAGLCEGDATCVSERGLGSLCVAGACTSPTSDCDDDLIGVVPAEGSAVTPDEAFAEACYYRSLDQAMLEAKSPARVAIFADAYQAERDLFVPEGVTLEGHSANGAPVALTFAELPPGRPALTLYSDSGLRGVSLVNSVEATGSGVALAGPLTFEGMRFILSNAAAVTITGTASAPVSFVHSNALVPSGTSLTAVGEGAAGGLSFEGRAEPQRSIEVTGGTLTLDGALVREHGGDAVFFTAQSSALIKNSTFKLNKSSIGLTDDLAGTSAQGLTFVDNDFSAAMPADGKGTIVCADYLEYVPPTKFVGNNLLPGGRTCPTLVEGACGEGKDMGYGPPGSTFDVFEVQCLAK